MDFQRGGVLDCMRIVSRRLLPLCAALSLFARLLTAQPFDIFPLENRSAGMKGYGVTDMATAGSGGSTSGAGTPEAPAPGQDLILARVTGIGLRRPGSSPV